MTKASNEVKETLNNILAGVAHAFTAVVANTYYLYERENGTFFVSLVEPEYWGAKSPPLTFVSEIIYSQNNDWKI